MGLAGMSLGRELRALAQSHTASVRRPAWHRLRTRSQTRGADCALTQQMIGCIKAISPCVKSASAELFPDLHTMAAPSGEERTPSAFVQVERDALCLRRFSCVHSRVYCGCTAEAGVLEASGPSVSGCTRAPRYFHHMTPYFRLVLAQCRCPRDVGRRVAGPV